MSNWQALIVEDEMDSAEVVARVLKHHKIPYVVAEDGERAVELLEQKLPELIIIDLALPGMDGWELLQIIRDTPDTAGIPVVAVTAYHSSNVAQAAIKAGFDAYFPKPIDTTSFVRELERIIGGDL